MSRMDWVPWEGYSTTQFTVVATGTTTQFPMLDLAGESFNPTETVGDIENQNRFFLHRIVGQWQLDEGGAGPLTVVILPGLVEQTGGNSIQTIIGAGNPAGGVWTDEFSNNEHWYIRTLHDASLGVGLNATENPWWGMVDIKPKRVIAKGFNPTLAFLNGGAGSLSVRFALRALVTRL